MMLVKGKGIPPGTRAGEAKLEDVPATLLSLLGKPVPAEFDGKALL